MKKHLGIIFLLLGGLGYISITQIFFRNKHLDFKQVYVAESMDVTFVDEEKGVMKALKPYKENDKWYLEILKTDEIIVELIGTEVLVDGIKVLGDTTIYLKGKSILLEYEDTMLIPFENILYEELNEETIWNNVKIGIGGVLAIIIALLMTLKSLPVKMRVSVGLVLITALIYLLSSILHEMFWTLFSATLGWFSGLGLSQISTKEQRKIKKALESTIKTYGSV